MRFAYGATRWVIITNQYAIKIARFRPLRPFIRLIDAFGKKEVGPCLKKHHENPLLASIKYLFAGVVANYTEYQVYKKYSELEELAPTLTTFFFLVNIQISGRQATEEDLNGSVIFNTLHEYFLGDTADAKQFCLVDEQVRLVDYGDEKLYPLLATYSKLKTAP